MDQATVIHPRLAMFQVNQKNQATVILIALQCLPPQITAILLAMVVHLACQVDLTTAMVLD